MTNEELVLLYQQGDKQALESLIDNNAGMVKKISLKYRNLNKLLELEDIIQAGYVGLINAANKYDSTLENKANFITYAFYYIEREIQICVNGRTSKDINNNKFYSTVKSLNVPIGEREEETELLDVLDSHDISIENVEEQLYLKQLREDLEKVMLENTTLIEREILKMRYGWDCNPYTYTYIGSILDIPKGKVQRIEYKAIRKIRKCEWARNEYGEYFKSIKNNPNIIINEKIDFANKYFKGVI